jgi:hypothetical protein
MVITMNFKHVIPRGKTFYFRIQINPAMGIEIPEVRVSEDLPRGFTSGELTAMWAALQTVKEKVNQKPSRYWTTVLSLYHGFRLCPQGHGQPVCDLVGLFTGLHAES